MNKPATIFKYQPLSAQTLQNLKTQTIYFASPLTFNDPYDCALKAGVIEPTSAEIEVLREHLLSEELPGETAASLRRTGLAELRSLVMNQVQRSIDRTVTEFLSSRGVACFSGRNDDLLMWSHYGGRYRGICLEFSTDFEPFDRIRDVRYRQSMPRLNAVAALVEDDYDQFIDLFFTKSHHWSYEKEWRCLHAEAGTAFTYPSEALKAVYFGPDVVRASMEIVCLILAGQHVDVRFFRGQRSTERFEVRYEEFTYTSYLEAKRLGLR